MIVRKTASSRHAQPPSARPFNCMSSSSSPQVVLIPLTLSYAAPLGSISFPIMRCGRYILGAPSCVAPTLESLDGQGPGWRVRLRT